MTVEWAVRSFVDANLHPCGRIHHASSRNSQQGMLPVSDPRPSTRVLGRVLGSLKYPTTYSSNVEFSTLVPVTYSSAPSDPIYIPDTYPST
jgi:hypothetical protein